MRKTTIATTTKNNNKLNKKGNVQRTSPKKFSNRYANLVRVLVANFFYQGHFISCYSQENFQI